MHCCCINFANESVGIERFFFTPTGKDLLWHLWWIYIFHIQHWHLLQLVLGWRLQTALVLLNSDKNSLSNRLWWSLVFGSILISVFCVFCSYFPWVANISSSGSVLSIGSLVFLISTSCFILVIGALQTTAILWLPSLYLGLISVLFNFLPDPVFTFVQSTPCMCCIILSDFR